MIGPGNWSRKTDFADMCHSFQLSKAEKAASAFDRVNRAENAREVFFALRLDCGWCPAFRSKPQKEQGAGLQNAGEIAPCGLYATTFASAVVPAFTFFR